MSRRRWLYIPALLRDSAALYRIDNGDSSELIVGVGSTLVNLGSYPVNINGLKYHNDQLNADPITSIDPPQPVTGLSIAAPEERRTRWVVFPPGEFTGIVQHTAECVAGVETDRVISAINLGVDGNLTVSGSWSNLVDNEVTRGPSSVTSNTSQEFTWKYQNRNRGFYFSLRQDTVVNQDFLSGNSSYVFSSLTHRPTGYLSIDSDGIVYAQTKYFNENGDMFADYFVISPSGQFTKSTYSFYQEVLTSDADFRGSVFNFVAIRPNELPPGITESGSNSIIFYEDFYLNSLSQPSTDKTFFAPNEIESAVNTQNGSFSAVLRVRINNGSTVFGRTVTFVKPLGTVELLSAVALE